jgi:hypothetical protein
MKKEKKPDFTDKDALEAANALKRLDLELNYDAVFFEGNGDLPPEILGAWLDNIKLFEDQSKNVSMITVHDFIGAPAFRRLEDIPSGELPQEIERVLEDLAEHAISIDRPDYISDADYYTFLTGKLMDTEMEDMRIPGMIHGFIFSEIDPEHPAVAINAARDILEEILKLKHPFPAYHILDETSTMKGKDLGREIEVFRRAFTKLKLQKFEPKSHDLKEDLCLLHFFIAYEGKIESGEKLKFSGQGNSLLRMKYGFWCLEDINFPGFRAAS